VSSTYEDLKAERQAAVEAILTAGHIPAGMELFTAGDESQMNVIKRWIDESDVYLLILGGRYGSIEPTSQKSYIHLEFEYAVEQGKALFSVVTTEECLDRKAKDIGLSVVERHNPQKLAEFRAMVRERMVRFWDDPRDIKIAILETLHEYSSRDDLKGWIPGNESVNAGALAEEMMRLNKENAELREQLIRAQQSGQNAPPMPDLSADLRIVQATGEWFQYRQAPQESEVSFNVSLLSGLEEPAAERKPRQGFWLQLLLNNSGMLATDLSVLVQGDSPIIDREDINVWNEGQPTVQMPHQLRKASGWHDAKYYEDSQRWSFSGSVYSFKPGQRYEFSIPVSSGIHSAPLADATIEVEVFPETGKHIKKKYRVADLLST